MNGRHVKRTQTQNRTGKYRKVRKAVFKATSKTVSNSDKYLLCAAVVDDQTRSSLAVDIRWTPRNRLQLRSSVGVDGLGVITCLERVPTYKQLTTDDHSLTPTTHTHLASRNTLHDTTALVPHSFTPPTIAAQNKQTVCLR